jgi:hypothetical protein
LKTMLYDGCLQHYGLRVVGGNYPVRVHAVNREPLKF